MSYGHSFYRGDLLTAWSVKANVLAAEEDKLPEEELLAQIAYENITICIGDAY